MSKRKIWVTSKTIYSKSQGADRLNEFHKETRSFFYGEDDGPGRKLEAFVQRNQV